MHARIPLRTGLGLTCAAAALAFWPVAAGAQGNLRRGLAPNRDVAFQQKLDAQIPLDVPFRDEAGKEVRLSRYFRGKPVVLVLVWYKCPSICTVILEGMVRTFGGQKLEIGKDYQAVTVSINPRETAGIAAAKKQEMVGLLDRPGAADGWHFLTGTKDSIDRLAGAIGYKYAYDARTDQYAHPAGIVVATPLGRVSHYLFGVEYRPRDLRLALVEGSNNQIGTPVDQVLLLCYHYDPVTGKYSLAVANILKIAGGLTVLILATAILWMLRMERRRARSVPAPDDATPFPTA
ncbi:MAG: SCO family protein [Chthonomonadales bacterium]|nr:SCO family protein [Chthonomonadales bacterium]